MFELVTADLKKKKSNFVVVIITAGDHKPGSFAKSHLIFCLSVCLALSPSGNGISSVLSLQAWPSATGLRPQQQYLLLPPFPGLSAQRCSFGG